MRLEPGFSVTGNVRIESRQNVSAALPQFNPLLRSADPMTGGGQLDRTKSRDTFAINDLSQGVYRLEASVAPAVVFENARCLRAVIFPGRDPAFAIRWSC